MSNIVKESYLNISRADRVENPREKTPEGGFLLNAGAKYIPSSNTPNESTLNVSEPSIFHEELNKPNAKSEEDYARSFNHKTLELNSWKSDVNSSYGEIKSQISFFSLPKFGLCEKSTQTNLTGRDIDDLEYFQKEMASYRTDLMAFVFKNKSSETMRRLFPQLDERKLCCEKKEPKGDRDLTLSHSEQQSRKENFINIKRANDSELNCSRKEKTLVNLTNSSTTSFSGMNSFINNQFQGHLQATHVLGNMHHHLHLKTKVHKGGRRKKKVEEDPKFSGKEERDDRESKEGSKEPRVERGDSKESKESRDSNLVSNLEKQIHEFNPSVIPTSNASHASSKKDFHDEFDIAGIINDIKNSSRKPSTLLRKTEPNFSLSGHNLNFEANIDLLSSNGLSSDHPQLNFNGNSLSQTKKLHPVRKFDAYGFFKAEYASFHKDLPEDELEKMCKKEWNSLDKGMKKIYNMNAERERKNHKLKKKTLMREQMNKNTHDEDNK